MMPSKKKKKYNARFPAGRIKKIMQTDEEVGKVAQAVPVIISRALELFVQSLLTSATAVTQERNAKTLSPSHLKQCIQREYRFDFLRDLVKNVPDVSAAEEKEMQSAENSPTSVGCQPSPSVTPDLTRREFTAPTADTLKRRTGDVPTSSPPKQARTETVTAAVDLTRPDLKPDLRRPNFYQETLPDDDPPVQSSVIKYACPQPSTSHARTKEKVKADTLPKRNYPPLIDLTSTSMLSAPVAPRTPITPVLNIDFTKNLLNPEIHVLNKNMGFVTQPVESVKIPQNYTVKALSRSAVNDRRDQTVVTGQTDDRLSGVELDDDYDT